jgi:hypothetical protein
LLLGLVGLGGRGAGGESGGQHDEAGEEAGGQLHAFDS